MKLKIKKILLCFIILFILFCLIISVSARNKTFTVRQGQTLIINTKELTDTNNIEQLKFKIFDRYYFPIEKNGLYYLIIGIDFEKEPGKYELSIFNNENLISKTIILIKKSNYPEISLNDGYTTFSGKLKKQRQQENENIYKAFCENKDKIPRNINKFINPLDKMEQTSPIRGAFGTIRKWRNKVITKHKGVDLKASFVPVKAVADGKVIMARNYLLEGKFIIIKHPGDIYSMYVHLSKINVEEGAIVTTGEKIGISGATGNAKGPHLHFAIKINCATVNPLEFLKIINFKKPRPK